MLILQAMPAVGPTYFKASLTSRRRPPKGVSIPALSATLPEYRVDATQLAAYCEVCGFESSDTLPITFPQVVATAMHMHLMTQKEFPLPMMGLVHLRNVIRQQRPLKVDEVLSITASIEGGGRQTDKGLEFDILTELSSGADAVYHAVTTILYRGAEPAKSAGERKPVVSEETALAQYFSFNVPADTGRRYGRISGDLNPIHLTAVSAKLFGFPRAIAHGMWSLARCAALLQAPLDRAPKELSVAFKRPLLLPGKVAVKYRAGTDDVEFSLIARSGGTVHLSGSLR